MQNRRDHLQAYQFAVERLVRAAVGRPGPGEAPFRRSGLGASIGVVLSVLICAGSFVFSLISPAPSQAWRKPGAIIVEKETGTRYLMIGGQLHPVANYVSALLAAGATASMQFVPRARLAGIPVGSTIGIAGAPDDLPAAGSLLPGVWALCARENGSVVLDLSPAEHSAPGPVGQRVFLASTDSSHPAEFVVWDSVKFLLPSPSALPALGLGDRQPIPADPAWLAALPAGPDVVPAAVDGSGRAGPQVGGAPAKIGTLFSTGSGGMEEDYILLSDGLAPITHTEAALFALTAPGPATTISTAAVAAAPVSANRSLLTRLPDFLSGPLFPSGGAGLCVQQTVSGKTIASELVSEKTAVVAADPPVALPANTGMLVQQPGANPDAQPLLWLIADDGRRYRIGEQGTLATLGYSSAASIALPPSVLALVPAGPALDSAAATRAVQWPSG
jgi:type VII secretion protein EccB